MSFLVISFRILATRAAQVLIKEQLAYLVISHINIESNLNDVFYSPLTAINTKIILAEEVEARL